MREERRKVEGRERYKGGRERVEERRGRRESK